MGDRFHELAMLKLAGRASEEESSELDDLLADNPEFRAEYDLLQKEVPAIKELIPMVKTPENSDEAMPEYAKTALLAEIGEIFSKEDQPPSADRPEQPDIFPGPIFWKWGFGLAFLLLIVATGSLWNLYNTNQTLVGEKQLLAGQLEAAKKELSESDKVKEKVPTLFSEKVQWDSDTQLTLYPSLQYQSGGGDPDPIEQVWRAGDFPLSFAVDTALLPLDMITVLAIRGGNNATAEKETAEAQKEAAKKLNRGIANILLANGITDKNATVLVIASLTSPLSETSAEDIVVKTQGLVSDIGAEEVASLVKREVVKRKKEAQEKANKAEAIAAFTSVEGISLDDATKIYEAENGFKTFEALSTATAKEIKEAGLAANNVEVEELLEAIKKAADAKAENNRNSSTPSRTQKP